MLITRRQVKAVFITLVACAAWPAMAQQQPWPTKPVRLIVPVAPGGATDATARLLQQPLADLLGQPIVIDNRPGAGGIVATEGMVRAGDGHTFAIVNSPHAANIAMRPKLPYDTLKDTTAIAFLWRAPSAISVNPSVPATTLQELIARSRSTPLPYGTPGVGFSMHLAGELLRLTSNAAIDHVPYRGAGPALNDALGGQIPMVISNVASSAPHVQAGRLRALAVTGATRSPLLPQVPTVAEQGLAGFDVTEWLVAIVPTTTPADVKARLHDAIRAVMARPDIAERMTAQGLEMEPMKADEVQAFVVREVEKLGRIIRSANIRPE
jgi:tripartite-type tricarboxylate transporter receptor subunit TctC